MNELLTQFDWASLVSKRIFVIPIILLLIVLIEKKLGPVIGGAFSGLPLVSGTLMCFSVFNQTEHDYSLSIYGALSGVIALGAMIFTYTKLTHKSTQGGNTQLVRRKRIEISLKSIGVYLLVAGFIYYNQEMLDQFFSHFKIGPFLLIAFCVGFNYFIYKKLPKIVPDEHTVTVKFKSYIVMAIIGAITFSLFSSIKTYGVNSALIGLISTSPVYLSIVVIMTHKFGSDNDLIHLSQGIITGLFGYIVFFSIFLVGLTVFNFEPRFVTPLAVSTTIVGFLIYAFKFNRDNKDEVTKMTTHSQSTLAQNFFIPEVSFNDLK